jgi:hypothetical protein
MCATAEVHKKEPYEKYIANLCDADSQPGVMYR